MHLRLKMRGGLAIAIGLLLGALSNGARVSSLRAAAYRTNAGRERALTKNGGLTRTLVLFFDFPPLMACFAWFLFFAGVRTREAVFYPWLIY
jgi:hypothetical protein